MNKPKVIILRTAGTNCDWETGYAFKLAGAKVDVVHVNRLINKEVKLSKYQILALPGGFSYGDDIASGKILANELKNKLGAYIKEFAEAGKPIIGICNGFQVLVKMGLLPNEGVFTQTTSLTYNDSDKFECRWVYLLNAQKTKNEGKSLWIKNMPDIIQLPVAHGEGKFVVEDKAVLHDLEKNLQIAFKYVDAHGKAPLYPLNPNGAIHDIAGIYNAKGNVLGLMPHPERFIYVWQHPHRLRVDEKSEYGWGLQLFKNAVDFVR